MNNSLHYTAIYRKHLQKHLHYVLSCVIVIMSLIYPMTANAFQPANDDRSLDKQPYLGVAVRDYTTSDQQNKCIVSWIYPGPLEGTGFNSKYMTRGDFLLAVNDHDVHTQDEFTNLFKSFNPGDEITLKIQRTQPTGEGSLPTPGTGDIIETANVVLVARADWSGPVSWIKNEKQFINPETIIPIDTEYTKLEQYLYDILDQQEIRQPIDKLLNYFTENFEKSYGANMLDRVAYGFYHPTRLAELQQLITDPMNTVADDPRLCLVEAAKNLDVKSAVILTDTVNISNPKQAIANMKTLVTQASLHVEAAFDKIPPVTRQIAKETMPGLVEFVANNFYINDHAEVHKLIKSLNASMQIDYEALFKGGSVLSGLMLPITPLNDTDKANYTTVPLPDVLLDAVTGDVLEVTKYKGRWFIYGGYGDNTYDMSVIDVVVDPAGNDTYKYTQNHHPDIQVIIDIAGNDTYTGGDEFAGPASALMGISLLIDHTGNDTYSGKFRSCGVGIMGLGILVDHAGADTYTGTGWSLGAGFYGFGTIIDLGNNNDVYTAHYFSEAIGGPRGFGLILDQNGRDLYRTNGPIGSVYGTDAVYAGISQGTGFGVRGYDSGGIGLLCDLAGDDRYEAGEFSQGGGYFWALGILYDKSGRDLYYGNRYTQAYAAHQALGILADDAGDDTYWGMTAATQSGSWDICSTLLIDRAGNDTYQADGLAQGGASMQAIAWLIDLEGNDRYNAPGGSTMGESGGNSYHYDATGCFSWSLLLDASGTEDIYSRNDRKNNSTITTGSHNEKTPENSSLYGIFIDSPEKLIFW